MNAEDLAEIEARAKAAQSYTRSILGEMDPEDGLRYWEPAENGETCVQSFTCPLCSGEGEVDGQRFDSDDSKASTLVAYGIGEGLKLSEDFVEHAAEDVLALVAEVKRLQTLLRTTLCWECVQNKSKE